MTDLKKLGFMATQYEKFGEITESEIIEAYIDEELEVDIDMLLDYNEYLGRDGYETYFTDLEKYWQAIPLSRSSRKRILVTSIIQMIILNLTVTQTSTAFRNFKLSKK